MTHTIAFPGISDTVFTLSKTAFSVFGLDIKWYGVIICIGVLLAMAYTLSRAPQFGLTADQMTDVLLIAIPAGIVGARLYYVVNRWDYYAQHPGDIVKTWEGGLAIYGGIILGFVAALIVCRVKKLNFLAVADLGSLGFLIGQSIGRWGNFVNAEAFGGPTSLPWGMSISGGATVHPAYLYESLWNLIGLVALHFYSKRRRFKGEIVLLYVGWYGLGRAWIEGLRTDSLYLGSTDIRISQLLAILCAVTCAGMMIYLSVTKKYPPLEAAAPAETPTENQEEAGSHDID